jgi:protein-tyrosine-phosphatase/predicted ATP-grasp superfamily ATP-dependent carboligase
VRRNKVLVFGDDTRGFLAIIRSLGRRGIAVHAAPANFRSVALRSHYLSRIHDLPPWIGDGALWLTALTTLLRAERFDLVIPCTETSLLPLQLHRAALSPFTRLAIPDDRAITILFDKHQTRELAKRLGVPVAAGRLLRADDTADAVLAEFAAPVVVKPRRSYSLGNLGSRGKVELVTEVARLSVLLSTCEPTETVLEQYFMGRGVGVSVLSSRGRVLQAFEHHRVREVAGAAFYRHSAPLNPALVAACEAIVAALEYTGVAMFEFKQATDGEWVLLEVNARPWGSLPLAVALGVDFPYRWYRLLVAGEETRAVPYRSGVYGRNLLPDLGNSLIEAETRRLGRGATAWFMAGRGVELLRLLTGREVHDVLVRDDPVPGLIELVRIAGAMKRRTRDLALAAARRRRRARVALQALRRAAGKRSIIFVCQGNICRSPFAAALLRTRLSGGTLAIASAGVLPRPGRPTPRYGVEAAARHGVDLSAHRSVWLSHELVDAASLLIAFDEITRQAVYDRYPEPKAAVMLLGDLAGIGEIPDPIDGGATEFIRIYDQIAAAVDELAKLIAKRTAACSTRSCRATSATRSQAAGGK